MKPIYFCVLALLFFSCQESNTCAGKVFGSTTWNFYEVTMRFYENPDSVLITFNSESSYADYNFDCSNLHIGNHPLTTTGLLPHDYVIQSYTSSQVVLFSDTTEYILIAQ